MDAGSFCCLRKEKSGFLKVLRIHQSFSPLQMKPTEKDFSREESVLPRSLNWPLLRQRPKDVHVIFRGYRHQLLHIGWRRGWGAEVCRRLAHLDDEVLEARGRCE